MILLHAVGNDGASVIHARQDREERPGKLACAPVATLGKGSRTNQATAFSSGFRGRMVPVASMIERAQSVAPVPEATIRPLELCYSSAPSTLMR